MIPMPFKRILIILSITLHWQGNLLSDPEVGHCRRLNVRHPVLTLNQMETLKSKVYVDEEGKKAFGTHVIDCTFPAGSGPDGMLGVRYSLSEESQEHIL